MPFLLKLDSANRRKRLNFDRHLANFHIIESSNQLRLFSIVTFRSTEDWFVPGLTINNSIPQKYSDEIVVVDKRGHSALWSIQRPHRLNYHHVNLCSLYSANPTAAISYKWKYHEWSFVFLTENRPNRGGETMCAVPSSFMITEWQKWKISAFLIIPIRGR